MKYKCFFAGYQKPAKLGNFKILKTDPWIRIRIHGKAQAGSELNEYPEPMDPKHCIKTTYCDLDAQPFSSCEVIKFVFIFP